MSTYKVHCVDYCLLDNFAWASSQQSCPWFHDPYFPSCGSICSLHSLQKVVFLPLPWSVKCPLLNLVSSPALCFISQRELRREGSFVYFCSSVIHLLEGWDPSMYPIHILNQKSSICIIQWHAEQIPPLLNSCRRQHRSFGVIKNLTSPSLCG